MKKLAFLAWIFIGVVSAAAQNRESSDVEKGRVAVGQACNTCHNLRHLQMNRKSGEQWKDTVYSMISRGAMVLPDEIEPITAYLFASFGPNVPRQAAPADGGAAPRPLPEAAGRAILQRACTQCHDLQTTTAKKASRDEWNQTVGLMIDLGAQLTPAERQTLVEYLAGLAR